MKLLHCLGVMLISTTVFAMPPKNPIEKIKDYQNQVPNLLHKNYAALATIDNEGYPKQRMIYIYDITKDGFVFHTDGNSDKVKEFSKNKQVSLLFIFQMNKNVMQVNLRGKIAFVGFKPSKYYRPAHDAKYAEYIFQPKTIKFSMTDSLKRENKFFTYQHELYELKNGQWQIQNNWSETLSKYEKK